MSKKTHGAVARSAVATARVWTYGHRPFVMGGSVNYVLGCDVPADGPHALGDGYYGYLITAPNGQTFVAEAETGALVGPTLKAVRQDIKEADKAVIERQLETAREKKKEIEVKDAEFFWTAMKCIASPEKEK